MAIENEFVSVIEKAFKDAKNVPHVSKKYPAPVSGKMTIDAADLQAFTKLYAEKPKTFGIGYGEVAIYWLYNYVKANRDPNSGKLTKELIKLNQGGNQPDLKYGTNVMLEIKAYKDFKDVSLGRFEDSLKTFRELVAPILGVRNLLVSGFVDIMRMNYGDLVEAAEVFCEMRTAIKDAKLDEKYDLFKEMGKKFKEFDNLARSVGLQECAYDPNNPRLGGKEIAYRLAQYAVVSATSKKPGVGQFMVNISGQKGVYDNSNGIKFFQIDQTKITKDDKVLDKGLNFAGGAFKVKFETVMPL
jgi:hypothetical protein